MEKVVQIVGGGGVKMLDCFWYSLIQVCLEKGPTVVVTSCMAEMAARIHSPPTVVADHHDIPLKLICFYSRYVAMTLSYF